jgi:hypothetical protein
MANITGNLPGENALVGTLSTKGSLVGGLGVVYGKDGKSAYEIAVKNGFEGTEEEWLASLQGKDGEDGKDGKDGTVSFDELTEAQRESLRGEQGEQGPQGERGAPGVVKYIVVTELPEEDTESAIYLVPSATGTADNMYDEYIYTDGVWEQIGSTAVEVDLTDYVKNTDYPVVGKGNAGVVKVSPNGYGILCNATGYLYAEAAGDDELTAQSAGTYRTLQPRHISKIVKIGLTDNKLEWTDDEKTAARGLLGAVGTTDYANANTGGVVKTKAGFGINVTRDGCLYTEPAYEGEITAQSSTNYRTLQPRHISKIVKVGLTDNKETWTEEEKAAARTLLGVNIEDGDEVSY